MTVMVEKSGIGSFLKVRIGKKFATHSVLGKNSRIESNRMTKLIHENEPSRTVSTSCRTEPSQICYFLVRFGLWSRWNIDPVHHGTQSNASHPIDRATVSRKSSSVDASSSRWTTTVRQRPIEKSAEDLTFWHRWTDCCVERSSLHPLERSASVPAIGILIELSRALLVNIAWSLSMLITLFWTWRITWAPKNLDCFS